MITETKTKTKEKVREIEIPVRHADLRFDDDEERLSISSLSYSVLDDLLNTFDEDLIITRIDGEITIIVYDDLIETV